MSARELREEEVEVNGLRLHLASAGAGPLILFLHGFPEYWGAWRRQLEHFGARGWLAAAPDQRGYDLSDKPADVAQYRSRQLTEDVRQLVLRLAGGRPAVLVAHDWGGAPAWNLAAAHPELLSHLVIVNSPHPYLFWRELTRSPAQQEASRYMLALRHPDAERLLSADGYRALWQMAFGAWGGGGVMGEAERQAYLAAWSRPGALTGSLAWYRASPLYPPTPEDPGPLRIALRPEDFTVRVPTLVLWGERDRALLPGCLDGLEACVPDLEVIRVPDASHWIVHEKPDLVNAAIERFVERRTSPSTLTPIGTAMPTSFTVRSLQGRVGQEIAVSPWTEVTQERIDRFAEVTEDRQWIHVDRERARSSPFGGTIAHGFLTLSLLSKMAGASLAPSDTKMAVNYGANKVRFTAPVPSGSRIRARFVAAKYEPIEGGVQMTWNATIEREGGGDKPCLVAEWLVRYYFA